MYRVYDNKKKCWVKDGVFLSPNNDLYTIKKGILGNQKMSLIPDSRYIFQRDINLNDKNNNLIYEGDVVKAVMPDKEFVGVVTYIPEFAAYMILDYNNDKYYSLGNKQNQLIEIIDNIIENNGIVL